MPPGQTGQVEVTIKTEGLTSLTKSVVVATNDPRQPQITLIVKGVVEPEIGLSESSIYFGSNPKGKEIVKEVMISVQPGRPVKIIGAESTDQYVTVTLEPLPGTDGKKYKLLAVQRADAKEGYHFGSVVIRTTSKLTPELKLSVRGMVSPASNNE